FMITEPSGDVATIAGVIASPLGSLSFISKLPTITSPEKPVKLSLTATGALLQLTSGPYCGEAPIFKSSKINRELPLPVVPPIKIANLYKPGFAIGNDLLKL